MGSKRQTLVRVAVAAVVAATLLVPGTAYATMGMVLDRVGTQYRFWSSSGDLYDVTVLATDSTATIPTTGVLGTDQSYYPFTLMSVVNTSFPAPPSTSRSCEASNHAQLYVYVRDRSAAGNTWIDAICNPFSTYWGSGLTQVNTVTVTVTETVNVTQTVVTTQTVPLYSYAGTLSPGGSLTGTVSVDPWGTADMPHGWQVGVVAALLLTSAALTASVVVTSRKGPGTWTR